MAKLNTPQLREFMFLVLGVENMVDGGCYHEDSGRANSGSNELIVLVSDKTEDVSAESGHEVGSKMEGI